MNFKTIREFHWLTKVVIALTGLYIGLLLITLVMVVFRPEASTELGNILQSLGSVLFPVFVVIFVIILITMAATRIKKEYLDQEKVPL